MNVDFCRSDVCLWGGSCRGVAVRDGRVRKPRFAETWGLLKTCSAIGRSVLARFDGLPTLLRRELV